jgi:hypothetical protein
MSNDYAKQKLFEAVYSLIGSSSIQERLTFAAVPLIILRSQPETPPVEIRGEFDALMQTLTKVPLSTGTGYTPRPVTSEEGEKLARQILSMFVTVMGGL